MSSVRVVFVTYIITMLLYLCTTHPITPRLIVLSVKSRTGKLGTLPNDLFNSIQEISFSRYFSS
jgi:hypothetical protein